jgi:D-tyrosyl-tRNA(Tyr) deacylase
MRAVLQRVARASVAVDGELVGEIGRGLAVLVGVAAGDDDTDAEWIAAKTGELRVFEDAEGKMNLSVADVGGAILLVSQFTLLADCGRGRRPSFTGAADPACGERLVEKVSQALRARGLPVATGRFGARMLVSIENEGPVTIILDSRECRRSGGERGTEVAR